MASSSHLVVANLVLLFVIAYSQVPWCNDDSSIEPDSLVSTNINNLLAAITDAAKKNNHFSVLESGAGKDVVYGLAQCRGDGDVKNLCYPCIQEAAQLIKELCPDVSAAQIWYDYCTIRYSQDKFFGTFDASQNASIKNDDDYPDPDSLFSELGPLFDDLIRTAPRRGIATGQVDLATITDTLYGIAHCTTDLRPDDCAQCLDAAVKEFDDFCKPKKGCRVFLSSCAVRYELYQISPPLDAGFKKVPGQAMEKLMEKYELGQAKHINKLRPRKSMMISSF